MRIRGVIFDFGGVLCFHPTEEQIARAARLCNVSPDRFMQALWTNRLAYDGGLDPQDYWKGVAKLAGCTFDDALIAKMIEAEIDFWSRFDSRVLDWTNDLRANGVRTGILSNLPIPLGKKLRETKGFLDHFDQVTFSCELRSVKPDREIYEHAVQGIGVPREETLFLDDRPENIEGARRAGLRAELFETWEKFVEETPARYGLPVPPVARRQ